MFTELPLFWPDVTPYKPLNRIEGNFVIRKDILCRGTYLSKIWLNFIGGIYAIFEYRNLAKIKYTTETVCHRNSPKPLNRIS